MAVWFGILIIGLLPKIVCLLVLLVILWPRKGYNFPVNVSLSALVILFYFGIMHGDQYMAKEKMNELCSSDDALVINKTVVLPKSYWDNEGMPVFFNQSNRLMDDIEGTRYREDSVYRNLESPLGVRENTVEFVNEHTGEIYARAKSYGYWGGWYHRLTTNSPQIQYSCYWDAKGKEKYSRSPDSHVGRLASWVFVPREIGVE